MRPLRFDEFFTYTKWCEKVLFGAQLQDVWGHAHGLVLEFYLKQSFWLWIDVSAQKPHFALLRNRPPLQKKLVRPVTLFLNSHAVNRRLKVFETAPRLGRVAKMQLHSLVEGDPVVCEIEIQVVPQNANILVTCQGKKISWSQVQKLPEVGDEQIQTNDQGRPFEGWSYADQWESEHAAKSPIGLNSAGDSKLRAIAKKEKALVALTAQKEALIAGEEQKNLKLYADLKSSFQPIPKDLQKYEKFSINQAFEKIKQLNGKVAGTDARIAKLEEEIVDLKAGGDPQHSTGIATKKMQKAQAAGRRLELAPNMEAVLGKSAADNLSILRQARAWDLWLHLRDFPSAHAIIFREKNAHVGDKELRLVGEWLLRNSKAGRGVARGKFTIVLAECRFVRPIKGDKLGRVNYQNEKTFVLDLKFK